MSRRDAVVGTTLALSAATLEGAQAYYVRQLSPGWPAQFHAAPPVDTEVVQISVEQLQLIGIILALAILCLTAVTLSLAGKKKKRTRP